jgi:parallel beta-helix repeat protein
LQGGTPGTADVGSFNVNGTGIAANLQGTTSVKTPLLDAISGTLSVGTSTATAVSIGKTGALTTIGGTLTVTQAATFNSSVTLAATQTLTLTGDTTANRPASPTEGTLYYDTTAKQLLIYANGKWQADRSTATKIVSTSASGGASSAVASLGADGADYVNTSTTSAQTVINSAISALPATGGSIYLMEGTYIVDGSINIPNNVSITGAGPGTVIKIKNATNASINVFTNSDTVTGTRVTIANLRIDGNKANQTSGTMNGVYFDHMGSGAGTVDGGKITNIYASNMFNAFGSSGISLSNSSNNTIVGNTLNNNSKGVYLATSTNNTISNNLAQGNDLGMYISLTSTGNTITGNILQSNTSDGIYLQTSSYNVITGNNVQSNGGHGINLSNTNLYNVIANNKIHDNGGATTNNGIYLITSDSNTITGNDITDTSHTTDNYAINITSGTTNTLSSNSLGGGSINDAGTGTIYNAQTNVNGYFTFKASTTRLGLGNVSPAYALDVTGQVNSTTGFLFNGTAGSTTTCNGATPSLTNVTIQGGIITGVTCAAGGGGGGVSSLNTQTGALTLQGTTNQITVTNGAGTITLSTPQDINTTSAVTFGSLTVGSAGNTVVLTNNFSTNSRFYSGTARPTRTIKLTPEFANSVFSAISGSGANVGYMISDYDSTNHHNYYQWTTDQATAQDYDIIVQYQLPSDFDGMVASSVKSLYFVTSTSANSVKFQMLDASGTSCGAMTTISTTANAWTQGSGMTPSGCTLNADDVITLDFRLSANTAVTNLAQLGTFQLQYYAKF